MDKRRKKNQKKTRAERADDLAVDKIDDKESQQS